MTYIQAIGILRPIIGELTAIGKRDEVKAIIVQHHGQSVASVPLVHLSSLIIAIKELHKSCFPYKYANDGEDN